jgi:hypothetical protein
VRRGALSPSLQFHWPPVTGHWPLFCGDRKAPERSQTGRVLVIGELQLRTNQGGIEQANEPKIRATTQQNAGSRAAGILSRGVQVRFGAMSAKPRRCGRKPERTLRKRLEPPDALASDQILVNPANQDQRFPRHRRTARSSFLAVDEDSLVPKLVAFGGCQLELIDGDDRLGHAFGLPLHHRKNPIGRFGIWTPHDHDC